MGKFESKQTADKVGRFSTSMPGSHKVRSAVESSDGYTWNAGV